MSKGAHREAALSGRATTARHCSCENPYQDRRYGKGVRLWNGRFKDRSFKGYRCTSCGKETTG